MESRTIDREIFVQPRSVGQVRASYYAQSVPAFSFSVCIVTANHSFTLIAYKKEYYYVGRSS